MYNFWRFRKSARNCLQLRPALRNTDTLYFSYTLLYCVDSEKHISNCPAYCFYSASLSAFIGIHGAYVKLYSKINISLFYHLVNSPYFLVDCPPHAKFASWIEVSIFLNCLLRKFETHLVSLNRCVKILHWHYREASTVYSKMRGMESRYWLAGKEQSDVTKNAAIRRAKVTWIVAARRK